MLDLSYFLVTLLIIINTKGKEISTKLKKTIEEENITILPFKTLKMEIF